MKNCVFCGTDFMKKYIIVKHLEMQRKFEIHLDFL